MSAEQKSIVQMYREAEDTIRRLEAELQAAQGRTMVERPPSNTASADFGEVDFGPVEVIVNGQRYVREETLFAALRELDDLREANRARDEQRAKADPNAAQRTEEPSDNEGLDPIETSPLTEREPDL